MVIRLPKGAEVSPTKYKLTHFLRIPLATKVSTPQLIQSLKHVSQDPTAAALPPQVWSNLDQISCHVTSLSLPTPARVESAIRLLETLDLYKIMSEIKEAPSAVTASAPSDFDSQVTIGNHVSRFSPPFARIHGLVEPHSRPLNRLMRLHFRVTDPAFILEQFCSKLAQKFDAHGFVPVISDKVPGLRALLMNTVYLRTNVPTTHPTRRSYCTPRFEATGFYARYKDYPFTTEFPLERICISEMGLKDVWRNQLCIRTGYREISSVHFPGALESECPSSHPDDTYERASKRFIKNQPILPLLIPSTTSLQTPKAS